MPSVPGVAVTSGEWCDLCPSLCPTTQFSNKPILKRWRCQLVSRAQLQLLASVVQQLLALPARLTTRMFWAWWQLESLVVRAQQLQLQLRTSSLMSLLSPLPLKLCPGSVPKQRCSQARCRRAA